MYKYVIVSCLLVALTGCADTSSTTTNSGYVMDVSSAKFTSPDGNDVILNGPAPDGQQARLVIPSGHGFSSATVLAQNVDEPLKINVNVWLNKLIGTKNKTYVDNNWLVTAIVNSSGEFIMNKDDLVTVNEQLKANGLTLEIITTPRGLDYFRH